MINTKFGVVIIEVKMKGFSGQCFYPWKYQRSGFKKVVDLLKEKGVKVAFTDLTRDDMAEAVEDAFRYSKMILAGATYDGGVFSPMEDFLHRLQHKGYQKKTVGLIENGSWAPLANKVMKEMLTPMKMLLFVKIRSQLNLLIKMKIKRQLINLLKKYVIKKISYC